MVRSGSIPKPCCMATTVEKVQTQMVTKTVSARRDNTASSGQMRSTSSVRQVTGLPAGARATKESSESS